MMLEDADVIKAVLAGDKDLFEHLIKKYQSKVYTLVFRLVRDRETALDLTQEVFFKIFQKLSDLKDPGKVSSWIMQVAHNTSLDWLKKRKVDSFAADFEDQQTQQKIFQHLQDQSSPSPEAIVELMSPSRMSELVNKLDVKYRTVIVLRFLEGYSFKEIAKILNLPLSTVKFRKHYALQLIKDRWIQISRDGDQ
jgi:RNA polymerase sigma-70 factor (ECF subfamily)